MNEPDKRIVEAIQLLVGTDGWERITAISRLLPKGHNYRERPDLLASHLLDMGIEYTEKTVANSIGIKEVVKVI
jgi:hypothetical protein